MVFLGIGLGALVGTFWAPGRWVVGVLVTLVIGWEGYHALVRLVYRVRLHDGVLLTRSTLVQRELPVQELTAVAWGQRNQSYRLYRSQGKAPYPVGWQGQLRLPSCSRAGATRPTNRREPPVKKARERHREVRLLNGMRGRTARHLSRASASRSRTWPWCRSARMRHLPCTKQTGWSLSSMSEPQRAARQPLIVPARVHPCRP